MIESKNTYHQTGCRSQDTVKITDDKSSNSSGAVFLDGAPVADKFNLPESAVYMAFIRADGNLVVRWTPQGIEKCDARLGNDCGIESIFHLNGDGNLIIETSYIDKNNHVVITLIPDTQIRVN